MTDTTSDEAPATYSLVLRGKGITVEQDVSGDVAREIISLVMGGRLLGRQPGVAAQAPNIPQRSGGPMSIREVIDDAEAKKNPQIVTVIGQYLTEHEGQERFTRADVKARFAQAGEPTPANFSRDFSLAVTSGWIAENPRNEFYVTDSGQRAIAAKFDGQKIRRPRRRATKKASSTKKGE